MVTLIKEIVMAESTKERILRIALDSQKRLSGYLGTSMNDIALIKEIVMAEDKGRFWR